MPGRITSSACAIMTGHEPIANRRRYPRLPVSVPVEGRWWDAQGAEQPLQALLTRLSEGGAMLQTAQPISANTVVEFEIKLGLLRNVQPRGTVRWWRRAGQIREAGMEFSEPARRIGLYVEREIAEALGVGS